MENIIVIGGGLMGTSAAWKLADRGAKVTLIESQEKAYTKGSSYGTARIARSLGPKKDVFSYVHNKTLKEVNKLLVFLNSENPNKAHVMEDIYSTSPVTYLYHKTDYTKVSKFKFKKQKKDYRTASPNSSFRKFGMTIPNNTIVVREKRKYSGTLNPTALINKLTLGIEKKGGTIKYQCKVINLVKEKDFFELELLNLKTNKTQILKAKNVVVATGAYTTELLKSFAPYFNKILSPKKIALSFLKISDSRYQQLSINEKKAIQNGYPFFSQIGNEYFAMVSKAEPNKSPIIKAGGHQKRRNIHTLDAIWDTPPTKKERKWIKKKFKTHLKTLEIHLTNKDIEEVNSYNCVYSETQNQTPIVVPIYNKHGVLDPNIIVIGGMSGIGAKGCLAYGALATDLILGSEKKSTKMYQKLLKTFSNPSVNLYTKRKRHSRLF